MVGDEWSPLEEEKTEAKELHWHWQQNLAGAKMIVMVIGHGHGYGYGHAHDYGYTPGVFNFQELADEYDGKAGGHRYQEGQHAIHLEEVSWVAIEREP